MSVSRTSAFIKYANRLKNRCKRDYAFAYALWVLGGRPYGREPGHLCDMATARDVRHDLAAIERLSTVIRDR